MDTFLLTLKSRNRILYYFGWLCLVGVITCVAFAAISHVQVLGINAFIKPGKFFISITIFCWAMAWYTGYLSQRKAVTVYSWVIVVVMTIEMSIILGQASQGKMSHFNVSSSLSGILFSIMGFAIITATLWTAYIGYLFMIRKPPELSNSYLWGIRFGILLFVIFAFEGMVMAIRLSHTVGAVDGGPGLPVLNWSAQHGDLRIAHFFGMHALQLIPLFGYYVARRPFQVVLFAAGYLSIVTFLLTEALAGKPLMAGWEN